MTKIAIAGFGFMGRMHYGNWKRIRGARVVAICDANLAQLSNVAGGNIAGADATTDFTGLAVYDDFARLSGRMDASGLTARAARDAVACVEAAARRAVLAVPGPCRRAPARASGR